MFDSQAHDRSYQLWANTHRPLVAGALAGVGSGSAPARALPCRQQSATMPEPTQTAPHVLREYALLADGERGVARRPARRLRLDVLPALGQRRDLLLADRRPRRLHRHADETASSGAATTSRAA